MKPRPIISILKAINCQNDWAFQWWDCATGKMVGGFVSASNDDNIYQAVYHMNGECWDDAGTYYHREKVSRRDWKAITDGFEHAGCTGKQLAEFIRLKLS
jgi:hypothetical protein